MPAPPRTPGPHVVVNVFMPGIPKSKDRPRHGQGRTYTPKATEDAEREVGWLLRAAGCRQPEAGRLFVTLNFFLPDARVRDLDNMTKLVLDAGNGIAWVDDEQIDRLHLSKQIRRGDPGTLLHVERL